MDIEGKMAQLQAIVDGFPLSIACKIGRQIALQKRPDGWRAWVSGERAKWGPFTEAGTGWLRERDIVPDDDGKWPVALLGDEAKKSETRPRPVGTAAEALNILERWLVNVMRFEIEQAQITHRVLEEALARRNE